MTAGSALDRLAAFMGVVERFEGYDGRERVTAPESKRAILAAMGMSVDGRGDPDDLLRALQAEAARRPVAEELVVPAGAPVSVPVRGPAEWRLVSESAADVVAAGRADGTIALPILDPGLYSLELSSADGTFRTFVVAAPSQAPSTATVVGDSRLWGMTCPLYGLRSGRNLGIGDYRDLATAGEALAGHGADFIGINPVHALGAGAPAAISPYSPSHRGFYNTLHIAVDAVPGMAAAAPLQGQLARIEALRAAELVDYPALAALHDAVLGRLFAAFQDGRSDAGARSAFEAYVEAQGERLHRFAVYEAIAERLGSDCRRWPLAMRQADSASVSDFAQGHRDRIRFHQWKQWVAETQIAQAGDRIRSAGMRLGLYLDIAVGVRPGGAELWSQPDAFAAGAVLGTPPDAFSALGQNWNLAPFSPAGLRRAGYAPFVEMLRAALRHAGLVRIDHFIGLERSFWIPECGAPGAYVRYPRDVLLAIVAAEAHRAGAVIVGEDLGLVPPAFRERIAEAGFYGCAVMQFETTDGGAFRDPRRYRSRTLASAATHDTPTVLGFAAGRDIDQLERIGRQSPEQAAAAREDRARASAALADACRSVVGAPAGTAGPDGMLVHGALAQAASELVAVQLDDILDEVDQQNLPGTEDEYPNWRRRSRLAVEDLAADPRVGRTAELMAAAGRSGPKADTRRSGHAGQTG